ncbi:radical SAM protein [bacterium]|nr:radical SAM protein [bacterium]
MLQSFTTTTNNLKEMRNLFIEMTEHNCNQRCRHCYIDFPLKKNVRDFIPIEKVSDALNDLKNENLQLIYLTGAEPMLHPNFNAILRLCLTKTPVCICTNASLINEKKARFLKKVEQEGSNEIIFKLSLDHYDEIKNDNIRSRGAYRQTLNAIKSLIKYDFNPIITITNYYGEPEDKLKSEFKKIFNKIGFETSEINYQINPYHDRYKEYENEIKPTKNFDCNWGRTLTNKGVYTCPFLANDHRGFSGCDFKNFADKNTLESEFCQTCSKTKEKMFGLNL